MTWVGGGGTVGGPSGVARAVDAGPVRLPRRARAWKVYALRFESPVTVNAVVVQLLRAMSVQSGLQAASELSRRRYW